MQQRPERGAGSKLANRSEQKRSLKINDLWTEEAVEDNLYDALGKRYTKALARSMANTKETKGADVLNNAISSSYTG